MASDHLQRKGNLSIQTKLKVNEPGDKYERAADRVAAQILRMPDQPRGPLRSMRRGVEAEVTDLPARVRRGTDKITVQRQEREAGPRVRFPTLEIFSALSGGALATGGRGLTGSEQSIATPIFGSSIDLSAVRIVETRIVSAPTTLGNYIRVPPGYSMPDWVLIHELAHIWQFQTRGTRYISDSLWHQTTAWLTRGGRGAAYNYTVVPGQPIDRYPAEHQASIVEDYFSYPHLRTNPEYQRLIAEVRTARPISLSLRLEEAAGILGQPEMPAPSGELPGSGRAGSIPLIRLEF